EKSSRTDRCFPMTRRFSSFFIWRFGTRPRNGRCRSEIGGEPCTNLRWSLKVVSHYLDRRHLSLGLFELNLDVEWTEMGSMSLSLSGVSRCLRKERPQHLAAAHRSTPLLRRSGRSPALPYPPSRQGDSIKINMQVTTFTQSS